MLSLDFRICIMHAAISGRKLRMENGKWIVRVQLKGPEATNQIRIQKGNILYKSSSYIRRRRAIIGSYRFVFSFSFIKHPKYNRSSLDQLIWFFLTPRCQGAELDIKQISLIPVLFDVKNKKIHQMSWPIFQYCSKVLTQANPIQ